MKNTKSKRRVDMLAEYDFSKGVRGKYAKRYATGHRTIVKNPLQGKSRGPIGQELTPCGTARLISPIFPNKVKPSSSAPCFGSHSQKRP